MASQVNVYAQLAATGFDLAPGTSDFWGTSGLDYGRIVWYAAWPLSAGEDRSLEVTHVSHEVDGSGNRWINVEVHNNSANFANYGLFIGFTDVIP